jgi:hypothetical protein
MALPLDSSGLPLDPATLQVLQQEQMTREIAQTGGDAAFKMNDSAFQQGMSSLFPSPEVQQARTAQEALQQAAVTQNDGESDLDVSIRQMRVQRDALAPFSPQAAAAVNTKLVAGRKLAVRAGPAARRGSAVRGQPVARTVPGRQHCAAARHWILAAVKQGA